MRHVQFSSGILLVLLFSVLRSSVSAESLPSTRYPELSFQVYYLVDREYFPQIKQELSTLIEWGGESQLSLLMSPGLRLQIGGGYATIRQENELIGDMDYALKLKSIFVGFSLVKNNYFSAQGKIAYESFTNDGSDGYYSLQDEDSLLTGSLNWTWKSELWRIAGKYYRSRETDPAYNIADQRAVLKLETRDLTGLEVGYQFAPAWETAVSLYHENYGTDQIDQLNVNGQIAFRNNTGVLSRIAAGVGYYFEEEQTVVNLTLEGGSWNNGQVSLGWSSEFEWTDVDASVLVGGSFWCRLDLSQRSALRLQLQGEQEMGDDRDSLLTAYLAFIGSF